MPQELGRRLKAIKLSGYQCTRLGKTAASWTASDAEAIGIVFIHGFRGDYLATWQWPPSRSRRFLGAKSTSMFEQLHQDPAYRCQYFTFGHPAGRFLSIARLASIAGALRTFIETHVLKHANAVLLVAHSIGGLIGRRAILDMLDETGADDLPIHGLLMYGTPNDGTNLARIPLPLRVLEEIRHDSQFIEALNREWIGRVINGGNPAYDVNTRTDLLCRYIAGIDDSVVAENSAAHLGYLGDVRQANQNHASLTKPPDEHHEGLLILKSFINDGRDRIAARRLLRGAVRAATTTLATLKEAKWLQSEHMTIELRRTDAPGILSVREISHRRNALCYPTYTVAIRLRDIVLPSDRHIDYRHTIGPGLLTAEEHRLAISGMNSAALAQAVNVRISVTINGTTHNYQPLPPETGATGYALLPFTCPDIPADGGRAAHLNITLQTTMQEKIGWYSCRMRCAITDELIIDWNAPFRATARAHLQINGEPAIIANTDAGANLIATHLNATGLIPPNASVDFIFERS